jgi:hypothetical protein
VEIETKPVEPDVERIGIAVIRAWTEGRRSTLRIRITATNDLSGVGENVTTVASRDAACDVVGAWLDRLLAADGRP